jgi:hypothetical protein
MGTRHINSLRAIHAQRRLSELGYENMFSALNALTFYKQRVDELERNKNQFPEPYYTKICNILANGKIKP